MRDFDPHRINENDPCRICGKLMEAGGMYPIHDGLPTHSRCASNAATVANERLLALESEVRALRGELLRLRAVTGRFQGPFSPAPLLVREGECIGFQEVNGA